MDRSSLVRIEATRSPCGRRLLGLAVRQRHSHGSGRCGDNQAGDRSYTGHHRATADRPVKLLEPGVGRLVQQPKAGALDVNAHCFKVNQPASELVLGLEERFLDAEPDGCGVRGFSVWQTFECLKLSSSEEQVMQARRQTIDLLGVDAYRCRLRWNAHCNSNAVLACVRDRARHSPWPDRFSPCPHGDRWTTIPKMLERRPSAHAPCGELAPSRRDGVGDR